MRTEAWPMKITFKLYATLSDFLPPGQRHNAIEIEIDPAATIADLVERFRTGGPLNPPDPTTFYGDGPNGYTDYPFLETASV